MQFDRTDKVCRFYLLSGESIFRRCSTSRFQHLQDISIPCRGKAFPDPCICQKEVAYYLMFPSPLGEKPFQTIGW
jgi:hypothetical protein